MSPLPYEFQAQSLVDEGRTSQICIDQIREFLVDSKLPDFPDESIALFLISCVNDIEATKATILAYLKCKKNGPEMFDDRDVDSEELQKCMKTIIAVSIPVRLDNNNVVHYFRLQDFNYANLDMLQATKAAFMVIDVTQKTNPPDGLVVLMDMKGLGFMHITRIKLGVMRKFFAFLQEAMPLRIIAIHILNTNYLFDKILDMLKVFIKSELLEVLHTYRSGIDMEEFYKNCIPAKCLPEEYGGELPSAESLNDKMIEHFRERKKFFDAEEALRKSDN